MKGWVNFHGVGVDWNSAGTCSIFGESFEKVCPHSLVGAWLIVRT